MDSEIQIYISDSWNEGYIMNDPIHEFPYSFESLLRIVCAEIDCYINDININDIDDQNNIYNCIDFESMLFKYLFGENQKFSDITECESVKHTGNENFISFLLHGYYYGIMFYSS